MSQVPDDGAFQLFIVQRKKDLQRIARRTRGECQFDDIVNEAWIMASSLQTSEGGLLDLADVGCQERLLSYLYQHLVRYTEQNIRHAVRLDHAPTDSNDGGDVHPLAYLLVSNDGRDSLHALLEREAEAELESGLGIHGSLAAAYVFLLRRFDNKMSSVADHLRISRSYAYRCCANARWLANHARHIPVPIVEHLVPGPWRLFRLRRPHMQLAFNFDDELPI